MNHRCERPYVQGRASFERKSNQASMEAINAFYGARCAAIPQRIRPPYGREVEVNLAAGLHPNVRLYACRPDPWGMAKEHRANFGPGTVLVLPINGNPLAYIWPPLRDVVCLVSGLPGDDLRRLARALVHDGCKLAFLLDATNSSRNLCVKAVSS